jgi:plastocyanin
MRFLVIATAAAALLAVAAGASAAPAKDVYQLKGEVYANSLFKIELETKAGKDVKTLKAGTYRIKIEDKASIHNFRLRGPGFNKATSVSGKTETFWTVRLRKGTYRFLCDPHASSMRGSFRVT